MKKTLNVFLIILLTLLSLLTFNYLNSNFPGNILSKIIRASLIVLNPVMIALVLLYLISPFTKRLVNKYKFNKRAAIITSLSTFFVVFVALIGFTMFFIVDQGILLYQQLMSSNFLEQVKDWFYINNLTIVYDSIIKYLNEFELSNIIGNVNNIFSSIIQMIATIILVPIFLWHFMNVDERLENTIKDNIPNKWHKNIIPIIYESNDVVANYFKSKLISMLILFFMFIFSYTILGLPIGYVIFFSFLIAVLDIVPYIGPAVGLLVPIIYIFSQGSLNILYLDSLKLDSIYVILILLAVNVLIQFTQNNMIIPSLSGKEMNIHSGIILVFMLFFGYILGVWGIILAIPLGGIILVIWKKFKTTNFFTNE